MNDPASCEHYLDLTVDRNNLCPLQRYGADCYQPAASLFLCYPDYLDAFLVT